MPMVTPTLNLPQPAFSPAAAAKTSTATAPTAPLAPPAPAAKPPEPSTTVTLSPQAVSAMSTASHAPSSAPTGAPANPSASAPVAHDSSVYESLKNGISTAVADVGDAIAGGAHAVVDGVETAISTVDKVATGIVELPFAAVSRACDAAGALIDEF